MSNLLLVILNDISVLPDLLGIWREIGVPGTTILQSAGGHASSNWFSRVGLGAINNLFEAKECTSSGWILKSSLTKDGEKPRMRSVLG